VSHAATRNGASILLLHTLQWLRANSEFEIEILVNGKGDLLDDYRALAPTIVWRNPTARLNALAPGIALPGLETLGLKLRTLGRSYDLLYLNTAAAGAWAPGLCARSKRVLWHIHELEYGIRVAMRGESARQHFTVADRFLSVSRAVSEVLHETFGVAPEKIDLVHGFVPAPPSTPEERQARRRQLLDGLGWSHDSFVVGACGRMGWRKGTDLFLQIASRLSGGSGGGAYRFLWVGDTGGEESLRFHHDAQNLGIADRCRSIPVTAEVADHYRAMDAFALTSREDPFPLVMLEAGACHVPTVCFARAGGGPEFVGDKPELVAPYLDVAGFAARLEALRGDRGLREQLGDAAAHKVRTEHVVESQGPKILASIQRCLAEAPGRDGQRP
jgi:glycosyltransferase involved in cell wall biosynthesis